MLEPKTVSNLEREREFREEVDRITGEVTKYLDKYKLDKASELLYDKFWHWYCDVCIEKAKTGELSKEAMLDALKVFLILLHPFMPFVTEALWSQELKLDKGLLIAAKWPK